ncbi:MAG: hypothetical protein B7Z15_03050 [Rhizobiales bacterium 32-66-8]|nr:MAG: hypothetical protein B7Z15_03050 [Rhizobiales bacterium 32-66-8]
MTLIAGILVLALLWYGVRVWTKSDPKTLKKNLIKFGAYLALAAAGLCLVTGRLGMALALGGVGMGLLGHGGQGGVLGGLGSLFGGSRPARISRVRSPWFDMELNHDSGALTGQVMAGAHLGASLDTLDVPTLLTLRPQLDPQSLALIEAYLDRRAPAWRQDSQANTGGGAGEGAGSRADRGTMTEEEAYEILGVDPGAQEEAVRAAHRSLMKKLHPDHGGSSYLAARVNQAKDVLLRKHR